MHSDPLGSVQTPSFLTDFVLQCTLATFWGNLDQSESTWLRTRKNAWDNGVQEHLMRQISHEKADWHFAEGILRLAKEENSLKFWARRIEAKTLVISV